jgi:hypothetical protein
MSASDNQSPLTAAETAWLAELIKIVGSGLSAFAEVGNALLEIRDNRLYRQTHATFDAFCQERWTISRAATCIDKGWLFAHPEFELAVKVYETTHPYDRAHPYRPGSGPKGQTCGTCAKLCTHRANKTHFKCRVLMKSWTAGLGTDVRKKDPACLCWEPRLDEVELASTLTRGPAENIFPVPALS